MIFEEFENPSFEAEIPKLKAKKALLRTFSYTEICENMLNTYFAYTTEQNLLFCAKFQKLERENLKFFQNPYKPEKNNLFGENSVKKQKKDLDEKEKFFHHRKHAHEKKKHAELLMCKYLDNDIFIVA